MHAGRRALLAAAAVTAFGALVRVAMAETLPLVVTPDGSWYPEQRGYLVWAAEIVASGNLDGPALRTPGYPALLAAAFVLGGVRDASVLYGQHLLGLASVALLTLMAARFAGAAAAAAVGVLAALDPWHLLLAHFALGETATVLALSAAAAALLLPRAPRPAHALLVGLAAGAACLIRPTAQLLLPFFAAAVVLAGVAPRRRLAAFALGVALVLGPWLAFNAGRGIGGLAVQRESLLFTPLAYHRLLVVAAMPPDAPDAVRATFAERQQEDGWPERFLRICREAGLSHAQRDAWSRGSLRAQAGRYPAAVWDTLRWLLGAGRADRPRIRDEQLRFVVRLTSETPGGALAALALPGAEAKARAPRLASRLHAAWTAWFEGWARMSGLPQVPLAAAAALAAALCTWRRRWPEAVLLAGSLAWVLAHALILHPWQRYTLPAQMLWYLALPLLWVEATKRISLARELP